VDTSGLFSPEILLSESGRPDSSLNNNPVLGGQDVRPPKMGSEAEDSASSSDEEEKILLPEVGSLTPQVFTSSTVRRWTGYRVFLHGKTLPTGPRVYKVQSKKTLGVVLLLIKYGIPHSRRGYQDKSGMISSFLELVNNSQQRDIDGCLPWVKTIWETPFSTRFGVKKFSRLHYMERCKIVWNQWWFQLLKPIHQIKVIDWLINNKSRFKQWAYTVDSQVLSCLSAFPGAITARNYDHFLYKVMIDLLEYKTWSELKSYKKELRKAFLSSSPLPVKPEKVRHLHRLPPMRVKFDKPGMFSLAMMTQTRSLGLGGRALETESITKWVETVSTVDTRFDYSSTYERAKSFILRDTRYEYRGSPRISLSTSVCLEFKERINILSPKNLPYGGSPLPVINLYDGSYTDEKISFSAMRAGDYLFTAACNNYKLGLTDRRRRVSSVLEPGYKSRVITVASAEVTILLNPFTKIWVDILKTAKVTKMGFSAGRAGWEIYESLVHYQELNRFKFGLSSDLETATDYCDFGNAKIVCEISKELGITPPWYTDLVYDLCTNMEMFSAKPRQYNFPPFKAKRGLMMGDPPTKIILSVIMGSILSWLNCISYNIGDDIFALSTQPIESTFRTLIETSGLKVSEVDTYTSENFVFFTEEYIPVPQIPSEIYSAIKRHGDYSHLWYVDYPKLRIVLPLAKEAVTLSDTKVGKFKVMANDLNYINKGMYQYHYFQIFSWLQECYLGVNKTKGMLYTPRQFGGFGKKPPFESLGMLKAYHARYKNEVSLSVLTSAITNRAMEFPRSHLSMPYQKHTKLESWCNVIVPSKIREIRDSLTVFATPRNATVYQGICHFLARNDCIVTEESVYNRILYLEYIRDIVMDVDNQELRKSAPNKYSLKDLSELVINLDFDPEKLSFTPYEEMWEEILSMLNDRKLYYDRFSTVYYSREPLLEQLKLIDPLKVDPEWFGKTKERFIRPEVGIIYEASIRCKRELEEKDQFPYILDPKLSQLFRKTVEDDDFIASVCSMVTGMLAIVITDDKKLCSRIAPILANNGSIGFRVSPKWVDVLSQLDGNLFKRIVQRYPISKRLRPVILHDTGSEAHHIATRGGTLNHIPVLQERNKYRAYDFRSAEIMVPDDFPESYAIVSRQRFWQNLRSPLSIPANRLEIEISLNEEKDSRSLRRD